MHYSRAYQKEKIFCICVILWGERDYRADSPNMIWSNPLKLIFYGMITDSKRVYVRVHQGYNLEHPDE